MMATKQKHRTAGNSYNSRQKVEIPIEVLLHNDSEFLNEFASQPELGQWGSKSRSDTHTDTSIDLDIDALVTQESKDSLEESRVLCQKKKFKKSDRPSCFKKSRPREDASGSQPDQVLINEQISTQLDAIGKHLTATEKKFGFCYSAKKVVCSRGTASSSLNGGLVEGDSNSNDSKDTDPKYKSQWGGSVDIFGG